MELTCHLSDEPVIFLSKLLQDFINTTPRPSNLLNDLKYKANHNSTARKLFFSTIYKKFLALEISLKKRLMPYLCHNNAGIVLSALVLTESTHNRQGMPTECYRQWSYQLWTTSCWPFLKVSLTPSFTTVLTDNQIWTLPKQNKLFFVNCMYVCDIRSSYLLLVFSKVLFLNCTLIFWNAIEKRTSWSKLSSLGVWEEVYLLYLWTLKHF